MTPLPGTTSIDPRWEQALTGLPITVDGYGTRAEITGYHDGMVWVVADDHPDPFPIRWDEVVPR